MDFISPYIDSDKKLHIRFEKLLSLLFSSGFTGKIEVFGGGEPFSVILSKDKVWSDKPMNLLGNLPKNTLFKVESAITDEMKKGKKEYSASEFLYSVIANTARARVLEVLKPYATEFISIKPEAAKLFFLHEELQQFVGQQKIEIFPNLKKSYKIIYFLLVSQYAVIVQATDEERAKITEELDKSDIFSEKAAEEDAFDKAVADKKHVISPEEEEIQRFLTANEHYNDVFQLFGLKDKFDERVARREYIKIMQKIHPDKMVGVSLNTVFRAKEFLQLAGECYELISDPETAADISRLMAKYGPVRSKTEYLKMKEYDSAMMKASALVKIGSYDAAVKVFDFIYKETKNPAALEQKNLALWKLAPKWTQFEKAEKYKEIREDLEKISIVKELSFESKYILAEIYEYLSDVSNALKILNSILQARPNDFRAAGMKKRVLYYSKLKS